MHLRGSTNFFFIHLQKSLDEDNAYIHGARPLMYAISIVLPLAYFIGLMFTLKTHSYIYEKKEGESEGSGRMSNQ